MYQKSFHILSAMINCCCCACCCMDSWKGYMCTQTWLM